MRPPPCTHFMSSFGTRRTASAPASTKYLSAMSSMPLVVRITFAPALMIFWMRSLVMSNSRSRICRVLFQVPNLSDCWGGVGAVQCGGGQCAVASSLRSPCHQNIVRCAEGSPGP